MENTELNTNVQQTENTEATAKWGGRRYPCGGRPKTERNTCITIRLSQKHDNFLRMQKNISAFVGEIIDFYCEQKGIEL